jgi:hypothetical protein
MTDNIKHYLRLCAHELIDDDADEFYYEDRQAIWDRMTLSERDECNELVLAVFGPWYDPADAGLPEEATSEANRG